jgi:hypothetical protein
MAHANIMAQPIRMHEPRPLALIQAFQMTRPFNLQADSVTLLDYFIVTAR